ncbi:MAG: ankyrin repeat domain-containing protein [bacterium]
MKKYFVFFITFMNFFSCSALISNAEKIKESLIFSAAKDGLVEDVSKLLNSGISVNTLRKEDGRTPIFIAVYNCNKLVVDYLLSQDAEVGFIDNKGLSPLDYCFLSY